MSDSRVERWLKIIMQNERQSVSIDEIGEVIGTELATTEDIDALFTRLEAAGITVHIEHSATPPAQLRAVLASARELRARGERPTLERVAKALDISVGEVRSALLYAQVLSR